jgi:predicted NACHT family NTPase
MFPQKFLSKMSQIYQLSKDQESVFLLRFGEDYEDREVATIIGISEEAYRKRMGEIYRKFDISGRGPGKNNRLIHILQNHFDRDQDTAIAPSSPIPPMDSPETEFHIDQITELVQHLQRQTQQLIQERCTTMRVLDMSRPVNLEEIYTSTDILEKINSRRRLSIAEVLNSYDSDRLAINPANENRVTSTEILQRHQKLMLLGKPGAGKTTLLKYTALKCSQGEIFNNAVPIFITLRQYASAESQPNLLEYISQDLRLHNIADETQIQKILQYGRAILFLDGLDEVREDDLHRVIEDIRQFSDQYYNNRFIITSRLGAQEYVFEKFTEVEIANFQLNQIAQFARRWFTNNSQYAETFLRKVEESRPIQELATNPLLLTLLCLVFDEYGDFPNNRAELYREGLDVLLKKWDAKRNIERHQIYKNLSMQRKEDLLAKVAFTTFYQGDYFFKKVDLEQYITDYIRNLPQQINNNEDTLQLDSEAIIKSIESQHGLFVERAKDIYSFSHLTFQEYLTAREIVHDGRQQKLSLLASKIVDHRWHDVLRLSVSMMRTADDLLILMKESADQMICDDPLLLNIMYLVNEKAKSVTTTVKVQSIRTFYLLLFRAIAQSDFLNLANVLARTLVLDLDLHQNQKLDLNLAIDLANAVENQANLNLNLDLDLDLSLALEYAQDMADHNLSQSLQKLISTCPDDSASSIEWTSWTDSLRKESTDHRNIGHQWVINPPQLELLQQYYNANQLIADCLESDCYIQQSTRQTLQNNLLLPMD